MGPTCSHGATVMLFVCDLTFQWVVYPFCKTAFFVQTMYMDFTQRWKIVSQLIKNLARKVLRYRSRQHLRLYLHLPLKSSVFVSNKLLLMHTVKFGFVT